MSIRGVLLLLLTSLTSAEAQEIKHIDLSLVPQRTELRHPPALATDCKTCVGEASGGGSGTDGASDRRDSRALGVYLLNVIPSDIDPAKPFECEFRVQNTGLSALPLPVSPHLSDLQPNDESTVFSFFSLTLVVRLEDTSEQPMPFIGLVELYGSPAQEGTVLVLKPEEWISVSAHLRLNSWPSQPISARLRGGFWLRRNTFHPRPGGSFTESENLYPNATQTPGIEVRLNPALSEHPGRP